MPSWNDLAQQLKDQPHEDRGVWIAGRLTESLQEISALRDDRTVILYASGFLQKQHLPGSFSIITHEDLHGLMGAVYGVDDPSRGLTLILHTPGGVTNAAESIVSYLRSKFDQVEVIVPTLAMSVGTMIALASDRIIMGRQSQLGPIDPQMTMPDGRSISAQAVVDQFERARSEVREDLAAAHVWASILPSLGPSLLQEAQNALDYSESMVSRWLARWMVSDAVDPEQVGRAIAHHFNDAKTHKSHGRRIDRDEARKLGLTIEDLEDDQVFQEAVLTAYHLTTLIFEQTPAAKIVWSDSGQSWTKNVPVQPRG